MSRPAIQSTSGELSHALSALHEVIAEAKAQMPIVKLIYGEDAAKQNAAGIRKLKDMRNRYSLLQWKMRKYLAGNGSYLDGAELNAIRSFLKVAVNSITEASLQAKAEGEYKYAKHMKRNAIRMADNQKAVRKMIVQEGKAQRKVRA